jgi:hypothetical protein
VQYTLFLCTAVGRDLGDSSRVTTTRTESVAFTSVSTRCRYMPRSRSGFETSHFAPKYLRLTRSDTRRVAQGLRENLFKTLVGSLPAKSLNN